MSWVSTHLYCKWLPRTRVVHHATRLRAIHCSYNIVINIVVIQCVALTFPSVEFCLRSSELWPSTVARKILENDVLRWICHQSGGRSIWSPDHPQLVDKPFINYGLKDNIITMLSRACVYICTFFFLSRGHHSLQVPTHISRDSRI